MSDSATVVGRLSDDQLHEYARHAYLNAIEARRDLEELKRQHLDLYRAFSRDIAKGGKGSEEAGPFGWSKLVVPISFWIVETILPRLALNLPRAIATPDSPSGSSSRCRWTTTYFISASSTVRCALPRHASSASA